MSAGVCRLRYFVKLASVYQDSQAPSSTNQDSVNGKWPWWTAVGGVCRAHTQGEHLALTILLLAVEH